MCLKSKRDKKYAQLCGKMNICSGMTPQTGFRIHQFISNSFFHIGQSMRKIPNCCNKIEEHSVYYLVEIKGNIFIYWGFNTTILNTCQMSIHRKLFNRIINKVLTFIVNIFSSSSLINKLVHSFTYYYYYKH